MGGRGPPSRAEEVVDAFELTRTTIDDCLQRWTPDDLAVEFTRLRRTGTQTSHDSG